MTPVPPALARLAALSLRIAAWAEIALAYRQAIRVPGPQEKP